MTDTEKEIQAAVKELQGVRRRLRERFENMWAFTLDGNLVGDIGEAYVFARYDVDKEGNNTKDHDFVASDGKRVQVKMTQAKTLGLGLKEPAFEYLIALRLDPEGEIEVLYNGPGAPIYRRHDKPHRRSVPIAELRERNKTISQDNRIPERR